eukprot:TRINITY_DN10687_c2_g1_i1.p1 TRINITY_DN10687_c2_g1~~TRINITY_DN10687_c2_g1_i1.p1  ORF type:complete len:110 (+),score=11.64 TRINITY_DN10687_c2_g1_i1:691-1020(+)
MMKSIGRLKSNSTDWTSLAKLSSKIALLEEKQTSTCSKAKITTYLSNYDPQFLIHIFTSKSSLMIIFLFLNWQFDSVHGTSTTYLFILIFLRQFQKAMKHFLRAIQSRQ